MKMRTLQLRMATLLFTLAGLAGALSPHVRADETLHTRERYVLRPGDMLDLVYRLTPEFNQTVTVQPDGFVNLDVVGDIRVAGLTVDKAHDAIVAAASARLNKPELNIILKNFDQPYVVVAGEVSKPGRIDLHGDTTALQAVMLAGGFNPGGYDSHVYLFRRVNTETSEVKMLNLHDIRTSRDLERDLMLQPGDMLLVPRNKLEKLGRFMRSTALGLYLDPTNLK